MIPIHACLYLVNGRRHTLSLSTPPTHRKRCWRWPKELSTSRRLRHAATSLIAENASCCLDGSRDNFHVKALVRLVGTEDSELYGLGEGENCHESDSTTGRCHQWEVAAFFQPLPYRLWKYPSETSKVISPGCGLFSLGWGGGGVAETRRLGKPKRLLVIIKLRLKHVNKNDFIFYNCLLFTFSITVFILLWSLTTLKASWVCLKKPRWLTLILGVGGWEGKC